MDLESLYFETNFVGFINLNNQIGQRLNVEQFKNLSLPDTLQGHSLVLDFPYLYVIGG